MSILIKLSETHYIVVEDSEIKEGDWIYWNFKVVQAINTIYLNSTKKITYSTQPLEYTEEDHLHWDKIKRISLSQIKEVIYGYNVYKMAVDAEYISHNDDNPIYPNKVNYEYLDGFKAGFDAHKELVKDNLFTVEQVNRLVDSVLEFTSHHEPQEFYEWYSYKIQLLLPKTEWDCCISNGKLVLL